MMKLRLDVVGWWFQLLHQDGEDTRIFLGRKSPAAKVPVWAEFDHGLCDGFGAFKQYCLNQNMTIDASPIPSPGRKPSRFLSLLFAFQLRRFFSSNPPVWANGIAEVDDEKSQADIQTIWLSEEQLQRAKEMARLQGVSLNSFLLFSLNSSIHFLFQAPSQTRAWLIPVNMREGPSEKDILQNFSAYIPCIIEGTETARPIHKKIKRALQDGQHWHLWRILNIGRIFGYWTVEKIFRQEFHQQQWVGVFSNLGSWKIRDTEDSSRQYEIYFCPPMSKHCPIATGVIETNKGLGLMVRTHAEWTRPGRDAKTIAHAWKESTLRSY